MDGTILALDVGEARIGMALVHPIARLPQPHGALPNNSEIFDRLHEICTTEGVVRIVVGLPRGMQGQETAQTAAVRSFGDQLSTRLSLPIVWQDEAVTSVKAEAELKARRKPYQKEDVDALAAVYILEDYIHESV